MEHFLCISLLLVDTEGVENKQKKTNICPSNGPTSGHPTLSDGTLHDHSTCINLYTSDNRVLIPGKANETVLHLGCFSLNGATNTKYSSIKNSLLQVC